MWRHGVAVCALLALTGCTPPPSVATRSILLGGDTVVATMPKGYCVDTGSSRLRDDFALLMPCAALGSASGRPDPFGLATLQVGPEDSGSIARDEIALRDFLISDAGAKLLSRSGNSSEITILSTQAFDDQVMVHFKDAGAAPFAGLQSQEWRVFCDINGRLVTIGVRGLASAPLQDGPGATLLKQFRAGVQPVPDADEDSPPDT
ncbi:MAG: dihydroxy-acid dehydratase [Yoonia sp.]